jgi:hypothetical protein
MNKINKLFGALLVSSMLFIAGVVSAAQPILDVIVKGSKTGNSWKMGVMLQESLTAQGYDSEMVHTGSCVNTVDYSNKPTRPAFFLSSGSSYASDQRSECSIAPTVDTFITTFFYRSQAMCTLKDNKVTNIFGNVKMKKFLDGKKRVTVASGASWPDGMFDGLEKQFNVDFVRVNYKGSGSQLKGLLAGDTDLLFTGYTTREINNPDVNCFAVSGDIKGKAKFSDLFPDWNLSSIGEFSYAHGSNIPANRMEEVKAALHESMKMDGKLKEFMTNSKYTPGYVLHDNGVGIDGFWTNAKQWGAGNK